jgi:diacylglycerol kinase (ATP)
MLTRIKHHTLSFKNAISGIIYAIKTQPNFVVQVLVAFCVLILALVIKISQVELAILVFTIFLVLTAEMINTSIESVTDLVSDNWHKDAKIAKDVSAGMVLLTSIGAIIIAMIIFGKYLV